MNEGEERNGGWTSLEDKGGVLLLLVTTELKVLASLERNVRSVLALGALESEHDLLGGLGLLVEDGLGLTTVTLLLPVVTTLTLSVQRSLTSLVLGDLVRADGIEQQSRDGPDVSRLLCLKNAGRPTIAGAIDPFAAFVTREQQPPPLCRPHHLKCTVPPTFPRT